MWLEDFNPDIDSTELWWNSTESIKEVSEKQKESSKKSQAKVQKTQKDEKKAKKYDILLAGILVKIIIDKKYDFILEKLFKAIHVWYSSNFILWIISLINISISNKIREISNKQKINFKFYSDIQVEFQDNNIAPEIKKRINLWIEDIIDAVSIEYSSIQTQNIILLLQNQTWEILNYTSSIIIFFLKETNVIIKESEAKNISIFILTEVSRVLKKLDIEEI